MDLLGVIFSGRPSEPVAFRTSSQHRFLDGATKPWVSAARWLASGWVVGARRTCGVSWGTPTAGLSLSAIRRYDRVFPFGTQQWSDRNFGSACELV